MQHNPARSGVSDAAAERRKVGVGGIRPDTARRHTDRVQLVLPYIASRVASPTDPLSLDELAKVANTAPFYFHRIFRDITGEPVHQYIRRLRLEFAAYRLLFSPQPIIDVAIDAGYESHAAFTRAFKKHFGAPPTTFREFLDNRLDGTGPADDEQPDFLSPNGITIKSAARRKVAFLRHFGPYTEVRATWARLYDWAERTRLCPESVEAIGVVYDSPEYCIGSNVRYDACLVVPEDLALGDDIGFQLLPAYDAIVSPHDGPQQLMMCTYVRLVVRWVARGASEALRRLPYYEVYRHVPVIDDTSEVHAEVHVSLA